jgi:Ca2+-transporting ATPase
MIEAAVCHLVVVETLGSASVITTAMTGTSTKNEMTVRTIVRASGRVTLTGMGYVPEEH